MATKIKTGTDLPLQVRWNVSDLQFPGPGKKNTKIHEQHISKQKERKEKTWEMQSQNWATMGRIRSGLPGTEEKMCWLSTDRRNRRASEWRNHRDEGPSIQRSRLVQLLRVLWTIQVHHWHHNLILPSNSSSSSGWSRSSHTEWTKMDTAPNTQSRFTMNLDWSDKSTVSLEIRSGSYNHFKSWTQLVSIGPKRFSSGLTLCHGLSFLVNDNPKDFSRALVSGTQVLRVKDICLSKHLRKHEIFFTALIRQCLNWWGFVNCPSILLAVKRTP